MPPRNERVATMVQRELAKNPDVGNDVLLEKAVVFDRSVKRLSPRQFHATYRLPALRSARAKERANGTAPAKSSKAQPAQQRPAVAAQSAPSSASQPAAAQSSPQSAGGQSSASGTHTSSSSRSTALARPHAAEREAVRQILQLVAREALASEDRASFIRLLDSLDERAAVILGVFGRS